MTDEQTCPACGLQYADDFHRRAHEQAPRLSCLRRQLAQRDTELAETRAENGRLQARDCKATVSIVYDDGDSPFRQEDCKIIDVGVADNVYLVEAGIVKRLQDDCKRMRKRTEAAEDRVSRAKTLLEVARPPLNETTSNPWYAAVQGWLAGATQENPNAD